MIVIKQDKCVIQIYGHANLTEFPLYKFRPLLQMASNKRQNDPEQIKAEMLEMLEREKYETQAKYDSHSFYGKKDHTYFGNKLKKIEKYRGIVEKWDI